MWRFFEPHLRRRLADVETGDSMANRVHAALLELLPSGDGSMEAAARKLAVSTRTLQRRLADEGTTFKACLSKTRISGPALPHQLEDVHRRDLVPPGI